MASETEADADAEDEQKLLELTECGGSVHGVWGSTAVEGCSDAAWPASVFRTLSSPALYSSLGFHAPHV